MMSHLLDRHLVVINQFMMATTKRRGKDFNLTEHLSSAAALQHHHRPVPLHLPTWKKYIYMINRQRNTGYIIDLDKLSIHEVLQINRKFTNGNLQSSLVCVTVWSTIGYHRQYVVPFNWSLFGPKRSRKSSTRLSFEGHHKYIWI